MALPRPLTLAASVSLSVMLGCASQNVSVGDADSNETVVPSCPTLSGAPRTVDGPATDTGSHTGSVAATGDTLVYFRDDKTPGLTSPKQLMRFPFPNGPEAVVADELGMGTLVAGGNSAFWVEGGALLREVDLSTGTVRVIDRKGGMGNALAATAEGDLAFGRSHGDGTSSLWRRKVGGDVEPVATFDTAIERILLSPSGTLVLAPSPSPQDNGWLYLLGPLRSLAAQPAIEQLSAPRAQPLSVRAPSIAVFDAFDGTNVYYAEPDPTDSKWRIVSMSLPDGSKNVVAQMTQSRTPSAVTLHGDDLVWIEADRETCFCNLVDGSATDTPTDTVENTAIRAVSKHGGEPRTLWSSAARVVRSEGLARILQVGCELAFLDGKSKLTMVLP